MTPAERIRELEDQVAGHARMLRSLATISDAIASGVPMGDIQALMAKVAEQIRDHLEPRRGMANGRR